MSAGADRAYDVASIELAHRKKIQGGGEQADPGSAPYRMKKQIGGLSVWLEDCSHELQGQRHAENNVSIPVRPNRRNNFGMEDAVSQGRHGK